MYHFINQVSQEMELPLCQSERNYHCLGVTNVKVLLFGLALNHGSGTI